MEGGDLTLSCLVRKRVWSRFLGYSSPSSPPRLTLCDCLWGTHSLQGLSRIEVHVRTSGPEVAER